MAKSLVYGYINSAGIQTTYSEEKILQSLIGAMPPDIELVELTYEDYESDFGHLLPKEIGGDIHFIQTISVAFGIGTVWALKKFAEGFLNKSGEVLFEKLFKPLDKKQQEVTKQQQKADRDKWFENFRFFYPEIARKVIKNQPLTSEERRRYEYWRNEGVVKYAGTYCLEIYVKETDTQYRMGLQFGFLDAKEVTTGELVESKIWDFNYNEIRGLDRDEKALRTKDQMYMLEVQSLAEFQDKLTLGLQNILEDLEK